jgi:Domain of unknown function (DUF4397)
VQVFTWPRRRTVRLVLSAAVAVAATIGPATAAAAKAPSNVGFVRLAHLSPDTPNVDVYLNSSSHKMKQQVFKGVGYGTVSGYLQLPVGTYSVAMRASGAAASTPALLTTDVTVQSNHAYTVAGVGKHVDLGLKVISDNLSVPMNGRARMRVIQASVQVPQMDIKTKSGETVATNVAFATTTSYRLVNAGSNTILVGPAGGGTEVPLKTTLRADSVYSLLVLDGKSGLTEQLITDATRSVACRPVTEGRRPCASSRCRP